MDALTIVMILAAIADAVAIFWIAGRDGGTNSSLGLRGLSGGRGRGRGRGGLVDRKGLRHA